MAGVVLGATLVVAAATRFHVGAHRRGIETLHAQRLLRLVAASAFEEACDAVEAANASLPSLDLPRTRSGARPRDLRALLSLPGEVAASDTGALYRDEGATVGSVRVASSDWVVDARAVQETAGGVRVHVREIGVLVLEVTVAVKRAGADVTRTVRTRRWMQATPATPGGPVSVRIHAEDLALDVSR